MGAIVLAGGRSSRMGFPKALLRRDGEPLVRLAARACAAPVVVVGPGELATTLQGTGAVLTREDPPGGGPSAGIIAGLAALPAEEKWVQLLPCDLVTPEQIVAALDATEAGGMPAVVPLASDGWPQLIMGRFRDEALRGAACAANDGRDVSIRRLLGSIPRVEVPMPDAWLTDIDTPEAARAAGLERPLHLDR